MEPVKVYLHLNFPKNYHKLRLAFFFSSLFSFCHVTRKTKVYHYYFPYCHSVGQTVPHLESMPLSGAVTSGRGDSTILIEEFVSREDEHGKTYWR